MLIALDKLCMHIYHIYPHMHIYHIYPHIYAHSIGQVMHGKK